jgi:hypothetical protein
MDWHALLQTLKENGVCRATEHAVANAPTVGSAVGMAATDGLSLTEDALAQWVCS